jgi:hypothetical protein
MGFWGTLGKIAGVAAPFAAMAIPGVGPAIGGALGGVGSKIGGALGGGGGEGGTALGSILGNLGGVLGGAAKGSADQRQSENPGLIAQYQANMLNSQQNDRRQLLASLLGGVQDAGIARPAGSTIPTFGLSGGLRPSALTNRDALMSRLTTDNKPLQLPTAGLAEKAMGVGGIAGGILGALGPLFGKKPSQPYMGDPNYPNMPLPLPPPGR